MTCIGIDTGGTNTRIWDGATEVLKIPTPYEYADYVHMLTQRLSVYPELDSLAIGLPAVIEAGRVIKAPNLGSTWVDTSLEKDIRSALSIRNKVVIIQDTEAAGYAMQEEELQGLDPTLFLTLSTGVGGALITKEEVLVLEVGHMPLNLSGKNAACGCGQSGCSEADLSGTAIFKRTGENSEAISDKSFWSTYAQELGQFFLILTSLFKVKQIILTGGVSNRHEMFVDEATEYVKKRLKNLDTPVIRLSTLGDNAGVRGAYWLAKQI